MKREIPPEPLLLKANEVAELLNCSRALAYRWMAQGVLPTVRVPGSRSIRVPKAALEAWVKENTRYPDPEVGCDR